MNSKSSKFSISSFWLNVGKLVTGSMLAQLSGIILSPVILRIFDAKDIGMLNLFNQVVAFFMVFSVLRLDRAIILSKNEEALDILKAGQTLILLFSILISLAVIPFAGFWFQLMKLEYPPIYIIALPIAFIFQSTINFYKSAGNVFKLYSVMASAIVIQSLVVNLLKIIFGKILGQGPAWLILAELSGHLATLLFLLWWLYSKAGFRIRIASFAQIKKVLASRTAFIRYDVPAALLNYFSSSSAFFLLALFYNTQIVGFYALSYSMLRLPMNLMGKAIGDVFYKDSADKATNPDKLRETAENVVIQLFSFGLLPMAFIFFFGDVVFSFAFGKNWITAGEYSQIFSFWTLVWFISSPISNLYYILKLQHRFTMVMFSSLVLRSAAIALGALYLDIRAALILFTLVSSLVYGYQVVFLLGKIGVKFVDFMKNLWISSRFSLVPLSIMAIVNYISPATPVMLAVIIPIIGISLAYRWVFKPKLKV